MPYTLESSKLEKTAYFSRQARTLKKSVSVSGIGLFSGQRSTLTLAPAPEETGIVFQRTDLPSEPTLVACLDNVVSTPRCTILGSEQLTIQTVEHVLAALSACKIDNAILRLSGPEVPIMDGSAESFIHAIEESGIVKQEEKKKVHTISSACYWSQNDIHLIALPSSELRISYTLHYPDSDLLRSQYYSLVLSPERFKEEIAPCRTFCIYEEIAPLVQNGLIKGGNLDNAVIIKDEVVINPGGVRFPDEMVRHKVLDLVGDLSLMQKEFVAHIIAIRSGHASNIAFGKVLEGELK